MFSLRIFLRSGSLGWEEPFSPLLQTLASNSHPFDLVVDCTGFTASSEIPLMWFKIFLERVPAEFTRRFSRVFFLNSNNAATKFLRKLYHLSGGMSLAKQTYVVSSMEDLKEHIAESAAEGLEYASKSGGSLRIKSNTIHKHPWKMRKPWFIPKLYNSHDMECAFQ